MSCQCGNNRNCCSWCGCGGTLVSNTNGCGCGGTLVSNTNSCGCGSSCWNNCQCSNRRAFRSGYNAGFNSGFANGRQSCNGNSVPVQNGCFAITEAGGSCGCQETGAI